MVIRHAREAVLTKRSESTEITQSSKTETAARRGLFHRERLTERGAGLADEGARRRIPSLGVIKAVKTIAPPQICLAYVDLAPSLMAN